MRFAAPHWQRFATTDSDEAHAFIRRAYLDIDVRFSAADPADAGLDAVSTMLGDVGVSRMRYPTRTRLQTRPERDVNISHLVSGRWSGRHRKQHAQTGPGDIRLVLPDDGEEFDFVDIDVIAVRLPRGLLEDIAHARTGIRPADLRFDHFLPMSARLARHWLHTLSYVTGTVLSDPVLQANPLIAEQARHLLAATALTVFPNTSLDARQRRNDVVTPRAVRRAMAYAESRADQPLTIDDLAAAAGVTPRALQAGFRRHHDTTPMGYVRRIRLARAHADLVAGDPSTGLTVAAVAARWGFTHPGRFSTDYRTAYGTTPGRTLRT